jgi:hypothetical protein
MKSNERDWILYFPSDNTFSLCIGRREIESEELKTVLSILNKKRK